jgi:FkbM family methyltransferase
MTRGTRIAAEPARKIHTFDNGVRVYDDHLVAVQRERYAMRNVHEADEEDLFVALVRGLPSDSCYLNIGCAIGYYPLLLKRLAPGVTIHAVEPLARHREYFTENMLLNGVPPGDVTLHAQAVSAAAGTARFRDQDYGSVLLRDRSRRKTPANGPLKKLLALLGPGSTKPGPDAKSVLTVKTTTLDALLGAIGETVNLLQMDVQGLEADVLRGGVDTMRTGRVQTFLIGTHGANVHRDCVEQLQRHGYCIELSEPEPKNQPDGIIVASKGVRRVAGV